MIDQQSSGEELKAYCDGGGRMLAPMKTQIATLNSSVEELKSNVQELKENGSCSGLPSAFSSPDRERYQREVQSKVHIFGGGTQGGT